jgi:23S rRNA (cytidine1920-2'-O)/16S rRNA (cytidine1409-2'-O)-methyltransferase
VTRRRLDTELVRRGLADSRSQAQEAVQAGLVTVAGRTATKAATMVGDDQPVDLRRDPRRFVSRGGEKLASALARFAIDAEGQDCLDAGASTGGFTDCLLRAGARRVIAVDVGYGQLAWELRTDDRVTVMERTNVRTLVPNDLTFTPSLVVADLSFISLRVVVQALVDVSTDDASFVLLVKPQFEAGPSDVPRGGVVRSARTWRRVLDEVVRACLEVSLHPQGIVPSPIVGPAGNVEFLLFGRKGVPENVVRLGLDAVVQEGLEVAG